MAAIWEPSFGLVSTLAFNLHQHYQHMQVVKCCLLQSSQDETIRTLYQQRKEKVCQFSNRWSGPKELAQLEPVVNHALCFPGQTNRLGLGANKRNPYIANPSVVERREKVTSTLAAQCEEEHVRHPSCLDDRSGCIFQSFA